MTVIIETGSGILSANAYADEAFVLAYLVDRNRDAAWTAAGATVQAAAVVAGTDYVEKRWGQRFKGSREFSFSDVPAIASIVFTGLPTATEDVTINDFVYTFVAALTTDAPQGNTFEVLIGIDAAATSSNLQDALVADPDQAGVTYQDGAVVNRHLTTTLDATNDTLDLVSAAPGSSGNSNTLLGSPTNVTLNVWAGGIDGGSQPLSFPQVGLFDRAGIRVLGIPLKLKQCTAEYADRVRLAILDPDPTFDDQGASITSLREKVGPIEVATTYSDGTHGTVTIRPYPAADRLVDDYVFPAGQAVR